MARRMGSPRHVPYRRRRTREGPEPACVQTPSSDGLAHAEKEGRINVLPWYRPVGESEKLQLDARAARKGKWSPRGTGMTVLTYP